MNDDQVLMDVTPEGIATITLNNPAQHNAFNPDLTAEFIDRLEDLRANPVLVRALILKAEGPVFSGLADFDWLPHVAHYTRDEVEEDAEAIAEVFSRVRELPQPVICVVHGPAAGYGLGLVAAADIAIATEHARFVFSEVRHGFIPALTMPYVVEAIGITAARRYLLTGEPFDAHEAMRIGLLDQVVKDEAALGHLEASLVEHIMAAAPMAVAETKALIDDVAALPIDEEVIELVVEAHTQNRRSDEAREGIAAFLEKRDPTWRP